MGSDEGAVEVPPKSVLARGEGSTEARDSVEHAKHGGAGGRRSGAGGRRSSIESALPPSPSVAYDAGRAAA